MGLWKLSNKFKNDMDYLTEENYKNLICDIIPEEIGKIEIKECGKTKNLTIFCLVYYTTYFSTKELKDLSNGIHYKKGFLLYLF